MSFGCLDQWLNQRSSISDSETTCEEWFQSLSPFVRALKKQLGFGLLGPKEEEWKGEREMEKKNRAWVKFLERSNAL